LRALSDTCATHALTEPLGDRVVANQNTARAHALPLTDAAAVAAKYTNGSCFYTMGRHAFYDVESAPHMSWQAENVAPVVPMYAGGELVAVFFTVPEIEQGLLSPHWWEPVPLTDGMMCANFCDSQCTFSGTSFWSTMHIFFRDYDQIGCPNSCTISCCP
jgi:hypothetical protein